MALPRKSGRLINNRVTGGGQIPISSVLDLNSQLTDIRDSVDRDGGYITNILTASQVAFTPTVSFSTPGTSSFSYGTRDAWYVKLGDAPFAYVYMDITFTPTIGTGTGTVFFSLPAAVTPSSARGIVVDFLGSSGWSWAGVGSISAQANASGLVIRNHTAGSATTNFTTSNLTNAAGHRVIMSGFYWIS